ARTAFLNHGTTISEIGLTVPDAAAAQARARALGAETLAMAAGAEELHIPAIRSAGGSVLRLLDRVTDLGRIWEIDFRTRQGPWAGAGLTGVDHIAQTMPHDE